MHSALRELQTIPYIEIHSALTELPKIHYRTLKYSTLKELHTIHYIEIHSALGELPTMYVIEKHSALRKVQIITVYPRV